MSFAGPVVLAGASGLVGGHVLRRLLAAADGPHVLVPARHALQQAHPRLDTVVVDLACADQDESLGQRLAAHAPRVAAFVCCLGTTIRAAGSREAFVAVDRELVLRLAGIARGLGAAHAVLVSSVGASAQSGNFYLRVKGEAERGIAGLGYAGVDLVRPGLLLGERSEARPLERFAQFVAPIIGPLLPGRLERYRAIDADEVAAAIVALLGRGPAGTVVHEHASLHTLALGD